MAQRGLNNPPSPAELNDNYSVNLPGQVFATYEPLYDYQLKTAAATPEQRFFVDPIGGTRTIADTNMELSGQIPAGQRFVITGIQVELLPAAALIQADDSITAFTRDVYAFFRSGALILKIGSIDLIQQGNLLKFAPVNRVAGFGSVAAKAATTVATTTIDDVASINYAAPAGREFAVNKLNLVANQNFSVRLVNASAISAEARVGVTLNGFKYRNAQ